MSGFSDDNAAKKFKSGTEVFQDHSRDNSVITNNHGYNIPLNQTNSSEENKDLSNSSFENPNNHEENNNQIAYKEQASSSIHSDRLLQKQSKLDASENDNSDFIHYDYLDKNGERIFLKDSPFEHDIYARREKNTDVGGGARIEAYFTDKGMLQSDIVLNRGSERTDNKGFRNKAIDFVDKGKTIYEDVKPEENEALASSVDAKAATLFNHSRNRHNEKKNRYGKIKKSVKDEIKQLEREIKEEKKAEKEKGINDYFNQSNGIFSDTTSAFANDVENQFNTSVSTRNGLDKFLNDKQNKTRTNPNSNEKFKADTVNPQFERQNLTMQERLEQAKSEKKSAKKSENKEVRKAAASTAVSKMLESKKELQNQLGDLSGQTSGDLIKDGSGGLLHVFTSSLKGAVIDVLKRLILLIIKGLGAFVSPLIFVVVITLSFVMLFYGIFGGIGSSDSGDSYYDMEVTGDKKVYAEPLSDDTINNIISSLYENYADLGYEQEQSLRYSLSKVGCEYDQIYHPYTNVDIFDCSSLVYRAYREAGVDISNNGLYTAAQECKALMESNKSITGEMKPGDLIFYGGESNGRYMGIYHVAIYVGRVDGVDKMVEARNEQYGVVYCDVRTNNVVSICRPIQ